MGPASIIRTMTRQVLLLLIDGNALVHRAFHALPPLTSSKTGEVVNAVYGFANTLLKVVADQKATHWAIAFDYPAPTFRHELYSEYKAHRPPTPEELIGQMGRIRELVDALGIPAYEVRGYEADDILGALARQSHSSGIEAAILTGDRDLLQLVGPGVRVLLPGKNFSDAVTYDEAAVESKYGVTPRQFADYKAFIGDSSDNIPGVTGIGEKTAVSLLKQFGNLEGVYDHIDEVSPKRAKEALRSTRDSALTSRRLATIVTDVPVELNLESCQVGDYSRERAMALLGELDFSSLMSRLPASGDSEESHIPASPREGGSKAISVATPDDQAGVLASLDVSHEAVVVVNEATARGNGRATGRVLHGDGTVVGVLALSPRPDSTYILDVPATAAGPREQMSLERPLEFLKTPMEDESIHKVCEDGKRVMRVLAEHDMEMRGLRFDLSIAAHLLGERNVTLGVLAANHLGLQLPATADARAGTGSREDTVAAAMAAQCDACRQLRAILEPAMKQSGVDTLYRTVELPLVAVLSAMEVKGILIDTTLLRQMSKELMEGLTDLEQHIHEAAGHKFNVNSPRQLATVLFEEMGIPGGRKTKSGYSTEASLLETLKAADPIVDLVLRYRQLAKLKSTYVDTLPGLVNPRTGRVHTVFSQTGASTGRLSSSDPNLQNLPIRSELGRKIRAAVVAPRGWRLLSADYSQIDLRSLAHLSGDKDLVQAFKDDEDIHAATASKLYGVDQREVTPDMRRNAKVVNFGVVYGMSDYGLEQATDLTRTEASQFIEAYFKQYPGVRAWLDKTKEAARREGYVTTLLGRRRYMADINSTNRQVREAAERMAINAPVQGTSADIIKVAMLRIHEEMRRKSMKSAMLLQIHDELLFEVPPDEFDSLCRIVRDLMPTAVELAVPLKVDLKTGPNWANMETVA